MEVAQVDAQVVRMARTTTVEAVVQVVRMAHTTMVEAAVQVVRMAHTTMVEAAVQVVQMVPTIMEAVGVTARTVLVNVPMLVQKLVQIIVLANVEINVPIIVEKLAMVHVIMVATEVAKQNALTVPGNVLVGALANARE